MSFSWTKNASERFGKLYRLFAPPPELTISEWADKYRVLSRESSAEPGRWKTSRAPYLKGIMDAISDPSVEKVVVMSSAQVGKTEIINNTIGYFMHYDPAPMMVVQPTIGMGETYSKQRLAPMIRDTPALTGLVSDPRSRQSDNTVMEKSFPGGYIVTSGANSAASLAGRPIRILLFDEVDRAPESAGSEGDPVALAERRTDTFVWNKKNVLTSTPTLKGKSRIEQAFLESTQEKYHYPCPSCGEMQPLEWRRLDFETLKMSCRVCESPHDRREWLSSEGQWIAENPDSRVRGFHMNALISPWCKWETLIEEWMLANARAKFGDFERLKVFINTRLAETWEERGEVVESHGLMDRREVYQAELPDGVCYLTMGVDVQVNRLAYQVLGHGIGEETWVIEYGELNGSPSKGDVWNGIDALLARKWRYKNGRRIMILRTAVDSGDGNVTETVYQYCRSRLARGVFAVKGSNTEKAPPTTRSKNAREKNVIIVGVNGIKSDVMARLRVEHVGDGYVHFPMEPDGLPACGVDERYFDMLTAEKRMFERDKKGFGRYVWVLPSGKFNESWDTFIYAIAARHLLPGAHAELAKTLYRKAMWDMPPVVVDDVSASPDAEETEQMPLETRRPPRVDRNAQARQRSLGQYGTFGYGADRNAAARQRSVGL